MLSRVLSAPRSRQPTSQFSSIQAQRFIAATMERFSKLAFASLLPRASHGAIPASPTPLFHYRHRAQDGERTRCRPYQRSATAGEDRQKGRTVPRWVSMTACFSLSPELLGKHGNNGGKMWGRGEEEMRGNFLQRLAAMRNCRPFSLHLPPPHPPPSVCAGSKLKQT